MSQIGATKNKDVNENFKLQIFLWDDGSYDKFNCDKSLRIEVIFKDVNTFFRLLARNLKTAPKWGIFYSH